MGTTVLDHLRSAAEADPGRPMLTYYDMASGERVELSRATLANWVAKSAHVFLEDVEVEPDDRVAVDLPAHWQAVVVVLSVWSVGAVLTADSRDADHLVHEQGQASPSGGSRTSLALLPLGRPSRQPDPGAVDYDAEVFSKPDAPPPVAPPAAADLAYVSANPVATQDATNGPVRGAGKSAGTAVTHAELVAAGREHAQSAEPAGSRILSCAQPTSWQGLIEVIAAPLVDGGSVVLCRNADLGNLGSLVRQENVDRVERSAADGPR